jgi:prepilin-type N-terminal cleavage/methylation domain-containing protein
MNRRSFQYRTRAAFSLIELMVATAIVGFATLGFLTYMRFAGVSVMNVTNQSTHNQQAGAASSLIVQRTRVSNGFTVQNGGATLVLNFDDDPTADSDSDGNLYNDTNHQETFTFADGDSNAATLGDNTLTYQPAAGATPRTMARRISSISGGAYFTATSSKSVTINFAISGGETSAQGQRVEIITSAFRLN